MTEFIIKNSLRNTKKKYDRHDSMKTNRLLTWDRHIKNIAGFNSFVRAPLSPHIGHGYNSTT